MTSFYCAGHPTCTTSADCPTGARCLVNTCCGAGVCASPPDFCPTPMMTQGTRSSPAEGPTSLRR
jgi:hypothetical protein